MIIIDRRGDNARSFATLRRHPTAEEVINLFHLEIEQTHGALATPSGGWYWRLAGFSLNEGPVIYRAEARDANNNPLPGIRIVRHWPGAPALRDDKHLYSSRGVVGTTEFGGDKYGAVEFQYTGDSFTGDNGGPDSFWVVSPTPDGAYRSDRAGRLGWWGNSNHFNPSPTYQLTQKGSELPPVDPTPDPDPDPRPDPPAYEPLGKFTVWRHYQNTGWVPVWTGDHLAIAFTRYTEHHAEAGPEGHVHLAVRLD